MKRSKTSMAVTALGAAVSGLGYGLMRKSMKSRIGAGVLGFGLAHVALGLLDLARNESDDLFDNDPHGQL